MKIAAALIDMSKISSVSAKIFSPALFLMLAVSLGGLRVCSAWAVFSLILFSLLAVDKEEFSFSIDLPAALFLFWLFLSVFFSLEPLNSFYYFSKYIVLIAAYLYASRAGIRAQTIWAYAGLIVGGAAALAVFLIPAGGLIRPNPNYGAAFIAAALAGVPALLGGFEGVFKKILRILCVTLLVAGLAVINSRGAWLAAFAGIVFYYADKVSWRKLLLGVLAVMCLITLLPVDRLVWLLKLNSPYAFERIGIWSTALEAAVHYPLFGYGPGLFERAFDIYKFPFNNGISYFGHSTVHAHSEVLNLAAEAGIPAAGMFVWLWAAAVFKSRTESSADAALKSFVVSLFVQSLFDGIFYAGAVQLFFWGSLGFLAYKNKSEQLVMRSFLGRKAHILVAAFVVLSGFGLRCLFQSNKERALATYSPPETREILITEALRYAPADPDLLNERIALSLTLHKSLPYSCALARQAALMRPKDPFPLFTQAAIFYRANAKEQAKNKLTLALALEPSFLNARILLSEILLSENKYTEAAQEINMLNALLLKSPLPVTSYDKALLEIERASYDRIKKELCRKQICGKTIALSQKAR